VLGDASPYFSSLLNPEGPWNEAGQKVVELMEDDPHAVYCMIRYIYEGEYKVPDTEATNPDFHLEVCKVAKKYLVPQLEGLAAKKAVEGLDGRENVCIAGADSKGLFEILERYAMNRDYLQCADSKLTDIIGKHLPLLLHERGFRASLVDDELNIIRVVHEKVTTKQEHIVYMCDNCEKAWLDEDPVYLTEDRGCPSCRGGIYISHTEGGSRWNPRWRETNT
jgi:hypothetical protein